MTAGDHNSLVVFGGQVQPFFHPESIAACEVLSARSGLHLHLQMAAVDAVSRILSDRSLLFRASGNIIHILALGLGPYALGAVLM